MGIGRAEKAALKELGTVEDVSDYCHDKGNDAESGRVPTMSK